MDKLFFTESSINVDREWYTYSVDKEWIAPDDALEGSESDSRDPISLTNQKPAFALSCTDPILFVEFAPFDWCSELICITFEDRIVIGQLKKQDRNSGADSGGDGKHISYLRTFLHNHGSPTCLCWNPATLCHAEPSKVCLSVCIGCKDEKLRVFGSKLGDKEHSVEVVDGHSDSINTAMYHPDGHILATGSDDFTCRIWDVKNNYECLAVWNLHSTVMSVRFSSQCPDHVIVAVKSGKIYFFSLKSKSALQTFYCDAEPLLMADWSLDSPDYLATIIGDELMWWDMSGLDLSSSFPVERRSTLLQRGLYVSFAPWSHKVVATFGGPEPQFRIKVFGLTELKEPLFSTTVKWRPWNITWHKRVPVLCAGVGKRLCFWELSHLRLLGE